MKLSQLKEEIRGIIRERSINAIQKDYAKVVADMEHHLELYKKSKGTPEEKKHIASLKALTAQKKKFQSEIDTKVASLYRNAELKVDESVNEASFQKGKTYGGTKCEGGCFLGKNGLIKIIKISKEFPNNTFIFRQDNFSGLQPHFIKNGLIGKATTLNPSYDLERNKVRNLKIGNDVILSIQLFN